MGNNWALRSGARSPRHAGWRSGAGSGRSPFPMRGRNLIILLTGIVVVVAVVLIAANAVAQRQAAGPHAGAGTSTSRSDPATAAHHPGALPPGAVPPTIGLRPGVTSPSASGLLTAERTLPKLSAAQLAGQRVIYSYTGLTPPAALISLIKAGKAAGVIFFSGNVQSISQLASVSRELQQAAMSPSDPVRLPLLLMTDQEGGLVRRLPGQPDLSA